MSSDTNQNRDVTDALTKDWWIDKAMAAVMWVGGISAIVAIVGIFIFITKEGAGFFATAFEVEEFLGSPLWRPTSEENPTYGTLALIAGTASVTGFAVLMAVPFPSGLRSTSPSSRRPRRKRPSRSWSSCSLRSRAWSGASSGSPS